MREFDLSNVSARYIDAGSRNTSYLIESAEGRFVVTVLERHSPQAAEACVALLHELVTQGFPAPSPRRTLGGDWVFLHRLKPAFLTTFVDGQSTGQLHGDALAELGALLARLHRSSVSCDPQPALRITEEDVSWLERAAEDPFARWVLSLLGRNEAVLRRNSERVPTHGDPFRENVIVRPDGRLVLIDWEEASLDLPGIDLGVALLAHCAGHALDASRAEVFLSGYRADGGAPLSLAEAMEFAAYAGLVLVYRRYRRYLAGIASVARYQSMQKLVDSLFKRLLADS